MDDKKRAAAMLDEAIATCRYGEDAAIKAIAAALRATPEGWVMVPVVPPTMEMWEVIVGTGLAQIDECGIENPNAERHERLGWFLLAWPELLTRLAARPQGVK